jgi:hypothetical protein
LREPVASPPGPLPCSCFRVGGRTGARPIPQILWLQLRQEPWSTTW